MFRSPTARERRTLWKLSTPGPRRTSGSISSAGGFEILGKSWAHGGDVADFIARDVDDLVFVSCQVTQNSGEGFPEEGADRAALERLATAYLAEHLDFEDILVRFDVVSMLTVGESRALLPFTS